MSANQSYQDLRHTNTKIDGPIVSPNRGVALQQNPAEKKEGNDEVVQHQMVPSSSETSFHTASESSMIRVVDEFSDASSMNAVRVPNRQSGMTDQSDETEFHRQASGVSGATDLVRVPNTNTSAMSESDMVRMDGVTESDFANDAEFTRLQVQDDDDTLPNRLSTFDKNRLNQGTH